MVTVMSTALSESESFNNHKGSKDSGMVSSPLTWLLSGLPIRRLKKLDKRSPVIVKIANKVAIMGFKSKQSAVIIEKNTAA